MNTTSKYDAIVVGGGPAGAAAAATLARGGLKTALLDKARFPRDKLCSGLLSLRGRRALSQVFGAECDPPVEFVSKGARLFFKERLINEIRDYKPVYFTSRCEFDHYLLEQARSHGVDVIEQGAVTAITPDRTAVITAAGARYETRFIIGADGASSRIRKELQSVAMDKRGFAVGLEMEVPRSFVKRDVAEPEIYLGLVRWGYAWVFPKARTLTVGVGGLPAANADMRQIFVRFAKLAVGGLPEQPLRSHPIPFGNYLHQPGEGSVLLAGDAAGLVEPVTGEGIAFAILSGYHAAQAVIEAHRSGVASSALSFYRPRYRTIVDLFDDARLLRHLVFPKPVEPAFAHILHLSSGLVRKHMDVVAGDAGYREYLRYFAGVVVWHLPRVILRFGGRV
jgi:geranylgeranyl reductase family protein